MFRLRQRFLHHRHAALVMLALAFSLRALIPQGMMAAPDAAHGITVLLCDGSGVAGRMTLPLGEKPAKPAQPPSCAFAVLAQAASADTTGGWIVPAAAPGHAPLHAHVAALNLAAHPRSYPPARAPPVAG